MTMSIEPIRNRLVRRGSKIFRQPASFVAFSKVEESDRLLNDLEHHPHAFVVACLMDRQVRAELAWLVPHRLRERLGSFAFSRLRRLSERRIRHLMTNPEPLHRFTDTMSHVLHLAIQRISRQYGGDASAIWFDTPSSAEVVRRFLEFDGFGPKLATMAANLLARDFKVPFADYYSIDVSADVHVRRVLARLGLVREKAKVEEVVYAARALHPRFPGIIDYPLWEVGRTWCRPRRRDCGACYMADVCPSA